METALKVAIAIALAVVMAAGIGLMTTAAGPAFSAASKGITYISGSAHYADQGVVTTETAMSPALVFQAISDLIYPSSGVNGFTGEITARDAGHGGWIVGALSAIGIAAVTFFVGRYLLSMLLGS